jgi:hypothetical protein
METSSHYIMSPKFIFLFAFISIVHACNQSFSQVIGQRIPISVEAIDSSNFILRGNSELKRAYSFVYNEVTHSVTLDQFGFIDYIESNDPNFKTSEGARVGMKCQELRKLCDENYVVYEKGWAKYVKLQSGWNAAFAFDKKVTKDSKVLFLFKR